MMLEQGQRKFEAGIFMKIVMVAILFLLPATSSASDDIRELGKAAEKLARAYNVDDALNDFFFGAFSGRSEIVSGASRSGNSSPPSNYRSKAKSRFTFKGLNKLEYKYGDKHRVTAAAGSIEYRFKISTW